MISTVPQNSNRRPLLRTIGLVLVGALVVLNLAGCSQGGAGSSKQDAPGYLNRKTAIKTIRGLELAPIRFCRG